MEMAIKHNNQTCRFIIFLRHEFYKIYAIDKGGQAHLANMG